MQDLSLYKTGVIWTGPLQVIRQAKETQNDLFNEPWMDNVRPELLFRYWKKKGCPGLLRSWTMGVRVFHKLVKGDTIISWIESPDFIKMKHNMPYTRTLTFNDKRNR